MTTKPSITCLVLLALVLPTATRADDPAKQGPNFEALLERTTLQQVDAIQDYVEKHPEAADVDDAYEWLFSTARHGDLESHVVESADRYLARDEDAQEEGLALAARAVRTMALARAGKAKPAFEEFGTVIRGIPIREGTSAVSLAIDLATAYQIRGDIDLARAVYEDVDRTFGLNPNVRRYTESRIMKLDLVGDVPPALGLDDLDGNAIDLGEYKGKVLLLDFWATWCGPCIAMLPRLKSMHAELNPKGFEILGLSLDDEVETVTEFAKLREIPWRMTMATGNDQKPIFDYHATSIPTLYVVDRSGKIVATDLRGAALEQLIRRLVAEEPPKEKAEKVDATKESGAE